MYWSVQISHPETLILLCLVRFYPRNQSWLTGRHDSMQSAAIHPEMVSLCCNNIRRFAYMPAPEGSEHRLLDSVNLRKVKRRGAVSRGVALKSHGEKCRHQRQALAQRRLLAEDANSFRNRSGYQAMPTNNSSTHYRGCGNSP